MCDSIGGQLLRIETQELNAWYAATITNGWLGANDLDVEGEWRWLNGDLFWEGDSSGFAVDGAFAPWTVNAPNASPAESDCARMVSTSAVWVNIFCNSQAPFACEPVGG